MYTAKDIRNICLMGHGGDGKTTLVEAMLYTAKGSERLGKVTDGNTVSDFDPEEVKRGYSIATSLIPVEFEGSKLNVLDNPGFSAFAGEMLQSLKVCDSAIIVAGAKGRLSVGAEKSWKQLRESEIPAFICMSRLDEEIGDFFTTLDYMHVKLHPAIVPFMFPIYENKKVAGCVDVLTGKGYDLEGKERPLSSDDQARVEVYMDNINEQVAETSEELMEKYFSGEPFTTEELTAGIKQAIRERVLFPLLCCGSLSGLGMQGVLRNLIAYAPNPLEGKPMLTADGDEFTRDPDGAPTLYFFKTMSDSFGKNSYFQVVSGKATPDLSLTNFRSGSSEKLGHLYTAKGKKNTEVKELCCGDLGVLMKAANVKTNDTLGVEGKSPVIAPVEYEEPCYSMAVYAKVRGTEDKIATGLAKLNEDDSSFTFGMNPETKEMVLSGAGDIHLDVLCAKLKSKYNVDVELRPAKIAYRETIRKKVQVHGRHKKQSGGHGQFGDVWIEFEPQDETEDLIFAERVVGGAVPKNFFPAVEKGLRESIKKGPLAGFPVVFLKATLYDGSYHPVDSSEMAFKTAASIAFKEGLPQAAPTILEPIGQLKVTVPDEYMGDVIGDLNKRRGRILGMTPKGDNQQQVEAEVPMGEMSSYVIDLRSISQGRGYFRLKFVRYEEVPQMYQAKIIEEAKKAAEAE
ncbi:MAG TPA: elongation factor G [Candidatus Avoscillospira avistercoris]|uniref:Elongation factor G n=1 Tax=Candidatus Avoscillospira avistercoris TaxID=2840707 RepID=A0A9D1F951_9FIRM|nr:elongation factor G [Candidatus Avoscillospira avistercoris]